MNEIINTAEHVSGSPQALDKHSFPAPPLWISPDFSEAQTPAH